LNILKWVKWTLSLLLTVVILGGSFGMYKINGHWEQVQQQLQRIPAIPE
jgi:UDP-N-acetylglucosamine:LPS N-acetylglucosamine transferase